MIFRSACTISGLQPNSALAERENHFLVIFSSSFINHILQFSSLRILLCYTISRWPACYETWIRIPELTFGNIVIGLDIPASLFSTPNTGSHLYNHPRLFFFCGEVNDSSWALLQHFPASFVFSLSSSETELSAGGVRLLPLRLRQPFGICWYVSLKWCTYLSLSLFLFQTNLATLRMSRLPMVSPPRNPVWFALVF